MEEAAIASRNAMTFLGYPRPDGRAGTRNHVLVLAINGLVAQAASRIAAGVGGALLVATPYGRGQYGPDKTAHERQLVGLAKNPNVAAVLVVGADRKTSEAIAGAITGKPAEIACLDDTHEDALALVDSGIRIAAGLARNASRVRRERFDMNMLTLGIECGHSDATSGIVANPLTGKVVDCLIDAGGTAILGETIEWLGAEHLLAARAEPAVGAAIVAAVRAREASVAAAGFDLLGNNPGAENIRGGLSTIEEKSLGAIAKAGSQPIRGLLALAEPPTRPGLYVMNGPSFSPESLTGFAAAGAQLMLFTTGAGNSFCNSIAPTLKISARPAIAAKLGQQIDFDAGAVFTGHEDLDAAADRCVALLIEVASGLRTWGEILGEGSEAFARVGGSL